MLSLFLRKRGCRVNIIWPTLEVFQEPYQIEKHTDVSAQIYQCRIDSEKK